MKPLYHGTNCDNVEFILKQGLRLDCQRVWSESIYETGSWIEGVPPKTFKCGVFLTKKIAVAISYAEEASKGVPSDELDITPSRRSKMCVVELKCLAKGAKLGDDGVGDLMTNKPVPARCIRKIWYAKDLRKLGIERFSRVLGE